MSSNIIDLVWDELNKQIEQIRSDVQSLHTTTEQAGFTDGIPAYTFVNLPTQGLADGATYVTLAWVSNGSKSGESAGAGTGVLAIYNAGTATWKRVGDYADVTI